jgi:hypothetical protein
VFSIRFPLHPGESIALEYLRNTGRKRAVPRSAVQEALRHRGYLTIEADAILGLLADRGLVAEVTGGVRPIVAEQSEGERAKLEIAAVSARLRALQGAAPPVPVEDSLRELWAHLDHVRQQLANAVEERAGEVERQGKRLRELIGAVRAEGLPENWTVSVVATHLGGISKLLGRAKVALLRTLERELGRVEQEIARARAEGEDWAVAWRKRRATFERIWGEIEERAKQFFDQTASLRAWLPTNDRLASLVALGAKVGQSDPALARSVGTLASELRERFATDNWAPVHEHQEVAARLAALESQVHGLLFSRVQAYFRELETLRVRFNDFLCGAAPQLTDQKTPARGGDSDPSFASLYAWALQSFTNARDRLRERRARGLAWRHPTRKSQSWTDIDAQFSRALAAVRSAPDFPAIVRVGELLLLMRQGFAMADAERGEAVYEGADGAVALPNVAHLLSEGRVRVHLEWIGSADPGGKTQ